jgi:hypothetical protein
VTTDPLSLMAFPSAVIDRRYSSLSLSLIRFYGSLRDHERRHCHRRLSPETGEG